MAHLLMREEPVRRGLSFRIGGDEFVTLFEGEEEETLLRELEVFHMAGAQAEVNGEPVTFAYGVASYDRSHHRSRVRPETACNSHVRA